MLMKENLQNVGETDSRCFFLTALLSTHKTATTA